MSRLWLTVRWIHNDSKRPQGLNMERGNVDVQPRSKDRSASSFHALIQNITSSCKDLQKIPQNGCNIGLTAFL